MVAGWKKVQVLDICSKGSSNIAQNKIENNSGNYPLFGASGYLKGIDFYQQEKPYIGIVKDGSGVGRVDFYPAKSSLLGTLQYIFPKEGYDIRFVGYALKSLDLASFASGAAIPHIYFRDYGKCYISVPQSVKEQKKVADELDLITSIIADRNKQIQDLECLSQSLFFEMFGSPIHNEKGWGTKPLGELCTVVRGGSPRPIEQFLGGTIPWIKIGDATQGDGIFLHSTKEHIIDAGVKKSRFIHSNSLIFANCGVSLGFARIITFDGCIHDGWLAFDDISDSLDKVFLLKSLNFCTPYFRSTAPSGTQPNLNTGIMKSFNQILPPLPRQKEYVEKVLTIEKEKAFLNDSLKDLQKLLKTKLSGYFEG